MELTIPHVITPDQAAKALGLGVGELAVNLGEGVESRLRGASECETLEDFDQRVAGARRLFESMLACDKALEQS